MPLLAFLASARTQLSLVGGIAKDYFLHRSIPFQNCWAPETKTPHTTSYTSRQYFNSESSSLNSLRQIEKPSWQSIGAWLKMWTKRATITCLISFITSFVMSSQNKYLPIIRSSMSKSSTTSALWISIRWVSPLKKWRHCFSKPSRVYSLTYPMNS